LKALGIDLAGSPKRPTGVCVVDGRMDAECAAAYTDEELLFIACEEKPDIIAVDAPLSLPEGRKDIGEKTDNHLRECDRELLKRKIRFFPVTLGPMRMLTGRGISLKENFEMKGFRVIEVYPGAAQDILGIPRQKFPDMLLAGLKELGIESLHCKLSVHELDAATSAYVGLLELQGRAEELGAPGRGIFVPRPECF
jgi:uncharacterized protein